MAFKEYSDPRAMEAAGYLLLGRYKGKPISLGQVEWCPDIKDIIHGLHVQERLLPYIQPFSKESLDAWKIVHLADSEYGYIAVKRTVELRFFDFLKKLPDVALEQWEPDVDGEPVHRGQMARWFHEY